MPEAEFNVTCYKSVALIPGATIKQAFHHNSSVPSSLIVDDGSSVAVRDKNNAVKYLGACSGYRSCRTPDDSPKRHSPLRDHDDQGVQASSRPSRYRALRRHPEFGS
jgi:hypothetical protein